MQRIIILILTTTVILSCQFEDQHCLSCNLKEGDQCDICIKSYITDGKCERNDFSNISKCFKYSLDGICSECQFGYYLKDNKCKSIGISSCLIVENENYCRVCDDSKKNDFFSGECTDKNCEKSNCKYCEMIEEDQEYCVMCKKGFSLGVNGDCEVEKIENCWIFDNGVCKVCKYGFFMKENNCLKSNSYSWEYSNGFIYLFESLFLLGLLL